VSLCVCVSLKKKVDSAGSVKYDAVIKQNIRKDQKVYSSHMDLVERDFDEESLARPSLKSDHETTETTREALEKLVEGKISAARPRKAPTKNGQVAPVYVRYTPGQQVTLLLIKKKAYYFVVH